MKAVITLTILLKSEVDWPDVESPAQAATAVGERVGRFVREIEAILGKEAEVRVTVDGK